MKFSRITVNARQMGGVPCIRGLRIPVATVVSMVADGTGTAACGYVANLSNVIPAQAGIQLNKRPWHWITRPSLGLALRASQGCSKALQTILSGQSLAGMTA